MKVVAVVLVAAVGLGLACGSRDRSHSTQQQAERDAAIAERDRALGDLRDAERVIRDLTSKLEADGERAHALTSLRDQMTAAHREFLAAKSDAERRRIADRQRALWGFDIEEARRPPPRAPRCPPNQPLC